jgi:hypothetical protein
MQGFAPKCHNQNKSEAHPFSDSVITGSHTLESKADRVGSWQLTFIGHKIHLLWSFIACCAGAGRRTTLLRRAHLYERFSKGT